jgi:hypothetical protein
VSHDRGQTFEHICEGAIGTSGVEDPMYAITPTNRIVATTFEGVTASDDLACTFAFAGGEVAKKVFIDLTESPNDGKDILVFASSFAQATADAGSHFDSRVWESKDEGHTFTALTGTIDPTLLGYTIDLTKTDPNRIYVTGSLPATVAKGYLLTSRDHGASWEELDVQLEGNERSVYIAAVDPNDAERVYLRTATQLETPDQPTRLLVREASSDGGAPTLRTLFKAKGALPGFALSPDGAKVYIGGPLDGLQVASTKGFAFEARTNIAIQCLAVQPDGIWACSDEQAGFIAGVSNDDGKTFQALSHFCTIRAPLSCPPSTPAATQCASVFPAVRASLGCENEAALDAGADAGSPAAPAEGAKSGCGCVVGTSTPWGTLAGALATIALSASLLGRRRRTRYPR